MPGSRHARTNALIDEFVSAGTSSTTATAWLVAGGLRTVEVNGARLTDGEIADICYLRHPPADQLPSGDAV